MHIHLYFTSEELYSVRNAQMGLSIHQTEGAVMNSFTALEQRILAFTDRENGLHNLSDAERDEVCDLIRQELDDLSSRPADADTSNMKRQVEQINAMLHCKVEREIALNRLSMEFVNQGGIDDFRAHHQPLVETC